MNFNGMSYSEWRNSLNKQPNTLPNWPAHFMNVSISISDQGLSVVTESVKDYSHFLKLNDIPAYPHIPHNY